MRIGRRSVAAAVVLAFAAVLSPGAATVARAASAEAINRDSDEALRTLVRSNSTAASLEKRAKGILVFPNIVKAGLIFGGAYGEGELLRNGRAESYYNSFTGSWGVQIGAQSYGYAVFLMTDKMIDYVHESHGWEIGVGPTVVVMDAGAAKNLSSSTLKADAYAFIFDQQGLMIGLSLEGTKISKTER